MRSRQNVPRPTRIETTGEKQSQAALEEMGNDKDEDVGSVNIQTDAVRFE